MPEQPTPITDRLSTDRPTTENGTHPSVTTSAKLHPARRRIATFDDYAEAERAVERLTSHDEVAADGGPAARPGGVTRVQGPGRYRAGQGLHARRHRGGAGTGTASVIAPRSVVTDPHVAWIRDVAPRTHGCEECLRMGTPWLHLRLCLTCGHVGCCDSSPMRHARAHAGVIGHPIVRSLEPGENWRWCYVDEAFA